MHAKSVVDEYKGMKTFGVKDGTIYAPKKCCGWRSGPSTGSVLQQGDMQVKYQGYKINRYINK